MERGSSLLRAINVLIPVELLCCSGLGCVPSCPWKWAPLWVCVLQVVFQPQDSACLPCRGQSSVLIRRRKAKLSSSALSPLILRGVGEHLIFHSHLLQPGRAFAVFSKNRTMEWQKCLAMWDFPAVLGIKSQELLYQQWQQAPSAEQWRAAFHLRPRHGCVERLGARTERSVASALLPVLSTCICTAGFVLCRVCRSGWVLLPALWQHGCLRVFSSVAVLLDMAWGSVQPGSVPKQPLGTAWGARGH